VPHSGELAADRWRCDVVSCLLVVGGGSLNQLWAHSANQAGVRHRLEDHLRGTAELARNFGEAFGAGKLAGYLGLVHDVGKASCVWQNQLSIAERTGAAVGIDHKHAGTWLALQPAGEFAMCVFGHHGGLPSRADLKIRLNKESSAPETRQAWQNAISLAAAVVPEICPGVARSLLPSWLARRQDDDPLAYDMLARMVFSALTDADFLDTEAHFLGCRRHGVDTDMEALADRYEARRDEMLAETRRGEDGPSPVDGWRAEVYVQAVEAAKGPCGMYKLAAPTGSGKTIAAGGFALEHARTNGLRRVVVAVPFISITDQNAQVYRDLLDEPERAVVLEHHSSVSLDEPDPRQRWWKLAAENWDAPFVVTTTVQLFQSLFDHRPAAMRKLHRLARSVIVLDEVQALPDRLLLPILSALRTLTEQFGATVLLASATQPSYWSLEPFKGLPVRDVIADPQPLYARFRRVTYRWWLEPEPMLAQVAAEAAPNRQVLIISNTTADSAALHRHLAEQRPLSLGPLLHLSTRMTAGHRAEVLEEIRARLADKKPVAVVSTQLIEAGVDVDFPVVYRAWAPADSLQQAAGRANRNGRLRQGMVVVFRPSDGGQPRDFSYTKALEATEDHFGPERAKPDELEELESYYRQRYNSQGLHRAGDGFEVEKSRRQMNFPAAADRFQLIKEHTVPVAVSYSEDPAKQARFTEITGELRSSAPAAAGQARQLLRKLRPYLATIPRSLARKARDHGYAEPLVGDLLEWRGPYDKWRGIDPADLADLNPTEVFVF
jgi:CRISPR-associated endonuclease/helicase Cas3